MEFKLLAPTTEADLSKMMIQFNNESLKKEITEAVKKYENIVYTDEKIGEAKSDRATLNKFKEALEGKRKEIKKAYLVPYEKFEKQIKELTSLVDKPISLIDTQVKEYENRLKEEKKINIETIYLSNIGELKELLPLSKLWNERWLNATYKISDIQHEIEETIDKAKEDIKVITDLRSEFELQIKDKYLQTLDLSAALKEKTRLEEQKAKLEIYQKSVDEEKAENEELHQDIPKNGCTETERVPEGIDEALEVIEFRCWVNKEQKQALKKFLLDNKIKVGGVE